MAEKTIFGRICVSRDTTANWNRYPRFVPKRGEVIVYEDHRTIKDELDNDVFVPGIKIGDGDAYLVDLPFVDDALRLDILTTIHAHTGNSGIHVTPEDKERWNNKLNYDIRDGILRFTVNGNKEED